MYKKLLLLIILIPSILFLWGLYLFFFAPYRPDLSKYDKWADFKSPDGKHTASLYVDWDNLDHHHHFLLILSPPVNESPVLMSTFYEDETGCGGQLYFAQLRNQPFPIKWLDNHHLRVTGHQLSIDGPILDCE